MDPYLVLGVDALASLSEVRTRYRVLAQLFHPDRLAGMPDSVRQEAERRMKELNAAYSLLEKCLKSVPPAQARTTQAKPANTPTHRTVVNPHDDPLATLATPQRSQETTAFWARERIEPVMIRLDGSTGLTLATPSIHEDERTKFLSDHRGVHLARTVEGLIDLAAATGPWRHIARTITPRSVVVLPEYRFDLTEAMECYANDADGWDPSLLTGVYNFSYEMALDLEIEEVIEAMMPGSALYDLYSLVCRLKGGAMSQWGARQGIARFDLADVFQAWCDITDNLSDQMRWHP